MGDYSIKDYQGGLSSLKPSYTGEFTGYRTNAGSLGFTTDPRTANVLKEASSKLSSGVKHIELSMVSPEVFDSIPKQHIEELRRLSKLTGVEMSLHGPVINTAGFSQDGFSDLNREASERRVLNTLERSYELNPKGNISVVFHSSEGIPGSEYEKTKDGKKISRMVAVNRESGQRLNLEEEERYEPGTDLSKARTLTPEYRLDMTNRTEWDNSINQLFFNKERADEILNTNSVQIEHLFKAFPDGKLNPNAMTEVQQDAYRKFLTAQNYLEDVHMHISSLFDKAYRIAKDSGNTQQQEALQKISNNFKEELNERVKTEGFIVGESKAMSDLLNNLKNPELAPEVYVPIEKFAVEQSSQTFGNAAFKAYKKFGANTPIMNIENPPAGFTLSTGEDLKNLVVKSREQFADLLVEKEGFSKKTAEKEAEKFIGATWDVGHINMIRKYGFDSSDVVKETEKIAPYVKHVHLSDNFGMEHTELPMGMGNVPIKEIMDKLGKEGYDGKKIIEAAQWWQHFQTSPLRETMEAFGSPVYTDGAGPYWNQSPALQAGYNGGLAGAWLPQINYDIFGGGFSNLPTELGGQRPGAQGSRMSGRGME